MTPTEAEAVVARLLASFRGRMGVGVRKTWADALADLDVAAVNAGIDQLARTELRMPSIAAVRQAATTRGPTAGPAGPSWQVLVTWRDPQGLTFAERRCHGTEPEAWADYHAACARVAQLDDGLVELLRYEDGRPVQTVERTG